MRRDTLTGPQKAAAMIVQLGAQRASHILATMNETEVVDLMEEVAQLPPLDASTVSVVVQEFIERAETIRNVAQGGKEAARQVLVERLGATRAEELLEQIMVSPGSAPFSFMNRIDARETVTFLQEEHPQTIAMVLAHLPADHAAKVLDELDDDIRISVAHRIGMMDRISPDVVNQTAAVLHRKLAGLTQTSSAAASGGVMTLVNILNRSERSTEKQILGDLESTNPELAEEVRSRMFIFDDIITLEDRSVQLVLRQVENRNLAVALKNVSDEVRNKITSNMSERASTELAEEIDSLGPTRLSAIESAQAGVVRIIRSLEASGDIVVTRGSEDVLV